MFWTHTVWPISNNVNQVQSQSCLIAHYEGVWSTPRPGHCIHHRRESPIPTEHKAAWAPQPIWTLWGKILVPAMNQTTTPWSTRLQPSQNTGWAIPARVIMYKYTNWMILKYMNVPQQQQQAMWNDAESENILETAQDCNDICTYAQNNTTHVSCSVIWKQTNCCGALVKAYDIYHKNK